MVRDSLLLADTQDGSTLKVFAISQKQQQGFCKLLWQSFSAIAASAANFEIERPDDFAFGLFSKFDIKISCVSTSSLLCFLAIWLNLTRSLVEGSSVVVVDKSKPGVHKAVRSARCSQWPS